MCRRLADAPVVAEVVPDDRWDLPLRVLAALHYLALSEGVEPWSDPASIVSERAEWVARFTATQRVQTNEVQRCWGLLPAFLSLGGRALDLLELGTSAGLNLVWDRYRYSYLEGVWGAESSPLELSGDERAPVPASLLRRHPAVLRRRGVDLDPIDVTDGDGARLLECFVWADQVERLARLRCAIELLRRDPPLLLRGDYVELLPQLLAERPEEALTVVFQTASTAYLPSERYEELRRALESAERPLAWISTRRHSEEELAFSGGFELEVALWPQHGAQLVARMGYHGQWLEWL